ncbi:MAG TPA: right-handed parallel beta-helix repeat-containing protein [Gemmatimonadaceae bacterium]|nr:right-handed parallel beta-helix repeat-containing protein [Gemmatimonadaceae bacterium]
MRTFSCLSLLAVIVNAQLTAQAQPTRHVPALPTIELRQGLVITESARIAFRTYRLPATSSLDSAVIIIRGDNITVDFAGATMEGTATDANPDVALGLAIRVDGGSGVRILNAHIRGYKVGIIARGTRGLSLIDNDLSYNWKPRLYSIIEHESLIDWLSFHHNEKDEWLRYGAGVYLADVTGGEIRGNTVEQGMNDLMLVRSSGLRIWNNTFSFNSGVGIGLYRSSGDTIMHNRVDYDVCGYSDAFYRRGQDAADLLMYEQSSRNVVAYNSMTHGGDGVFLWAGQSTMDTGAGGANDNFFHGNDFSFAPANGIEATFTATFSSPIAWKGASTVCGAVTASTPGSLATTSCATVRESPSSTGRTTSLPRTPSRQTRRRSESGEIRSSLRIGATRNIATRGVATTGSRPTSSAETGSACTPQARPGSRSRRTGSLLSIPSWSFAIHRSMSW